MKHRLLALLGSLAFGIRQFTGSILSFVGLRWLARFAVPLLVVLLAIAAVISARDTATILASRPEIQDTTLADVASREDPRGSIWFEFDALIGDTHLPTPADRGTFFYLARDPAEPSIGLLVRSTENDAFFRQRVITARLVDDAAFVEAALGSLPPLPSGFNLEQSRYVDEIGSGGDAEAALVPSQLEEEAQGSEVLVTGRVVTPRSHSACAEEGGCDGDEAAWLYYLADPEGGTAIVLRSPHPPDATPARLQGLYTRDTFDLAPVLESDWYRSLEVDAPTDRAFQADRRPPILVQASWIPTILFAAAALLLIASLLIGYPVFGRVGDVPAGRSLAPGEGIDVQITGRLAREKGPIELNHSPGGLERLSIPDLALRMWRYGMLPRELSRREAEDRFVAQAAGEHDRLIVHERDQSVLVMIERDPATVSVEAGRVYRVAGSRPAIHVRQGQTDVYLATTDSEQRDRAAAEVRGEAEEPSTGR